MAFLPLCHIFERMAGLYAMLGAGATIAYAESMEQVAANAVEVRPTILTGVPRFYEKVYARVMENALSQPNRRSDGRSENIVTPRPNASVNFSTKST